MVSLGVGLIPLLKCGKDIKCVLPPLHEGDCILEPPVEITYTDWKKKTRMRRISPTGKMMYQSNPPWAPKEQWLMGVIDHQDGRHKWFQMAGISHWKESV